ncbi:MAG: pyruvate, phosphate dikinase [Calditrichaeota bacterium]|nr:MAG: pyruvate, phosphate dikinase [Calditrichota bacterium]MBL1206546.1 pyruvate, phosphate dikinase [Calditrichota bacterium]NOG46373.1 pyruvate, phosphate dikinase [Calditrichota bacterium]
MTQPKKSFDTLVVSLEERVRELNCMYEIEEVLAVPDLSTTDALNQIVNIIPIGWQYPEVCRVQIMYGRKEYISDAFRESPWMLHADIKVNGRNSGYIRVYYTEEKPEQNNSPFLEDEVILINNIATRLSHYVMYQKLKLVFNKWETTKQDFSERKEGEWKVVLELLKRTDPDLFIRISRKMLNHLVWQGIPEAEHLLHEFSSIQQYQQSEVLGEVNTPLQKRTFAHSEEISSEVFKLAQKYLSKTEILTNIQKWMQQDKTAFLVRAAANNDSSLTDIANAIRRYYQIAPDGLQLMPSAKIGVRAALLRRFFSDQLEFINIAKNYVMVNDFNDLIDRTIFPPGSHGKLGGKSAGVFLAERILRKNIHDPELLKNIKVPKTWHISSDTMIQFMHYNNLEEILEQKYKSLNEVRKEYPHVVQLFKNSYFPPEIKKSLSVALDDFGFNPIIIRSSSLLEDRLGSAFSGKYKSLFLANQGPKRERLEALMDAIAEVYASTIGPDPIEYRTERGLLDFHEEMGIMIQEVVGKKVGDYFLPCFAGVAFSNNEFRWSPRIKREDGLIRLVPGLGTRAVDRVSDDYPILIAPGQPGLRANVSVNDVVRYSPHKADVLNLETHEFETIELKDLFKSNGDDYPHINRVVSIFEHHNLRRPMGINTDYGKEDLVVTFDGLTNESDFILLMQRILKELQGALATPVDIEFASNGDDLFLLQCRPQSYSKYDAPTPIPENIPKEDILFSANRYISNGLVPDITHIVYVDPEKYNELNDLEDLKEIGKAISKLNIILPKRQFILMGPGRWGSRGDIKLGVSVTYSDINNTAVLIEVARKKGNYVPDLSFGTHFFQDLVEASIRYLPLYPDGDDVVFNEHFLLKSPNLFTKLLPEFEKYKDVVHVINVASNLDGRILKILMNADLEKAVAIFSSPGSIDTAEPSTVNISDEDNIHSEWRVLMAEKLASQLDKKQFGVNKLYLGGSSLLQTAQTGSDIDLYIDFVGNKSQKKALDNWLMGWSLCLDEINYQRTGYKSGGMLDVSYLDEEQKENIKEENDLKELILSH